ncbi:MAG: 16S rRNA (adenine(1518)-N(6)/adenine(1519)-N(6))-dimethyltransferase RsmA [Bacteroidales bacterium]|nr:16S rRNA (adenine(1518)-N(6)/adenine(1519)-N(6))-dimethyltransferase RsmA [Bacteroidales bacterium]
MGDYTKVNAVKPKKALGQHFLVDLDIARNIVEAMSKDHDVVIEVGAGMGVLTQYIIEDQLDKLQVVEIDGESVDYLMKKFPMLDGHIVFGDFLKYDIAAMNANGQRTTEAAPRAALGRNDVPAAECEKKDVAVIGNFPYNISSQIFFQILKYRDCVSESVGMVQKEVAERLAAGPGSKTYGILSVLLQAYYDIEYLFTVHENVFNPPPKVKSAVIRLKRNGVKELGCDEKLFVTVVKQAFNQRRKTMRNSLRTLIPTEIIDNEIFNKRPEQLSVAEFVELTNMLNRE